MSFFETLMPKPGNPGPAPASKSSMVADPEFDVLGSQAKLVKDKIASLKAGDTSVTGKPSPKSLEYIKGLSAALAADSENIDLSSLKLCFIRDNLAEFTNRSKTKENVSGWKNFITIEDDDVASFVSKVNGFYAGDGMNSFLNMTTIQKAKLYPKISLYKVQGSRKTEIRFPTSLSDVGQILRASGTGDYGIKSVDFDFKNQNAFGAGRIVDVRIQIFLTSGNALVVDRGGFSLSDLILRRGQVDPKVYDSKAYELQMDVGYMKNGGSLDRALDKNTTSMILNLVEYDLDIMENGVINMSMEYKARIEQDLEDKFEYDIFAPDESSSNGRIKQLGDKYATEMAKVATLRDERATVESELTELRSGIKVIPSKGGHTKSLTEGFKQIFKKGRTKKVMAAQGTINKIGSRVIKIGKLDKKIDNQLKVANKFQQDILETRESNKISKYGKLLEILFQDKKIQCAVVPKTDLVIYGAEFEKILQEKIDETADELGITDAEDLIRATNYLRSQIQSQVKKTGVDNGDIESLDFAQVVREKAASEGLKVKEALLKTDFSEKVRSIGKTSPFETGGIFSHIGDMFRTEADSKPKYTEYEKIYWFYLGDLINLLMENNDITGKLQRDKLGFVFGPTSIDVDAGVNTEFANIADIPITLEMYQQFFFKNIVEKELDQYFLHDFIKQAMYQLLMPSLNQKCFGTSTSNPVSINSVIIELDKPLEAVWIQNVPWVTTGTRYDMFEPFKVGLSNSRIAVKNSKPDQRYSYVMFYANDGRISNTWNGKRREDAKKGIFHFKPGVDRGLVKQVKFRKNKKPGFTTMMVERAFAENKESLQLWAIFDIDLVMIGNTLLKPGMHIYIDPSTVGLGSPQSLSSFSRSIGIGGYYLVTSVSNTISDGDWETNVVAKWVTSGSASGSTSAAAVKATAAEAKKVIGKDKKPASKKKKSNKKQLLVEPGSGIKESPTGGTGNLLTGKL